jgi:hypothetical protein
MSGQIMQRDNTGQHGTINGAGCLVRVMTEKKGSLPGKCPKGRRRVAE